MNDAPRKPDVPAGADRPVADEKDAFPLDIPDGLARDLDSAFIAALAAFAAQAPMAERLYAGVPTLKRPARVMLIGRT